MSDKELREMAGQEALTDRPGSATGPTTQSVTMPNDSKTESAQPGSLHPAGSALKPWQYQCSKCGKIKSFDKRGKERGWCASCEVATWSPEKTKALARVIGAAMRGDKDKLPSLTTEALKHCAPNK